MSWMKLKILTLEADILRTAMLPLVVRGPWTKVQGSHGGLRGPHAMGPSHGAAIVAEVEQAWVHVWVAGCGPIRGTRVHAPIQCLLRPKQCTCANQPLRPINIIIILFTIAISMSFFNIRA